MTTRRFYKGEGNLIFIHRTLPCIYAMEAFFISRDKRGLG
ncbi:hypothetical protein bthur0005_55720 [Bacillus thuringiensis serovar pakistani str. T13001]|nr:hypothetical protein bthur0005_55720 [Bacillus thuringiensis serovar pakistani str. T13001]